MFEKLQFENKLLILLVLISLPAVLALLLTLIYFSASVYLIILLALLFSLQSLATIGYIYNRITWQYRTLSSLLEAVAVEDYSLRGRHTTGKGALAELIRQINAMSDLLSDQRTRSQESQLLLRKVINQIDVAIITIDDAGKITLLNPFAASLFLKSESELIGKEFSTVGGSLIMATPSESVCELEFPAGKGQYRIYHDSFREQGVSQHLIFLSDVRQLLRNQERSTWKNLIRVLSHEINNSLTPIASISQTLEREVERSDLSKERQLVFREGFGIISDRAAGLRSFLQEYRQLAQLPEPDMSPVSLASLITNLLPLFPDVTIDTEMDEDLEVSVDAVQIEQVMINLLKNAIEASPPGESILIKACLRGEKLLIQVIDSGKGITSRENLFTPFYSTKSDGSGIGLVLSRQIVEAHNGELYLDNRDDNKGAVASVELVPC
jgi:nitrogen fixation/metabolism regulation signal transduction histidine kinase